MRDGMAREGRNAALKRVLVLTGAGISAESGVPTFRGPEGLWKSFRPEELATPSAFTRDPRLVWEWYDWRRRRVRACQPNAAHMALAKLALHRGSGRTRIVTQNVDGLHAVAAREAATRLSVAASPHAALPLELHGSLFRVRCTSCGERREDDAPVDASSPESLPRCARCSALLRPESFGWRPLDDAVLRKHSSEREGGRVSRCRHERSGATAASLAMVTKRAGGELIEVNPETTPLTPFAGTSVRGTAADLVPRLVG